MISFKRSSHYTKFWSAFWGLVIVICGCAVVWGVNTGAPDTSTIMGQLANIVEDVDPTTPLPENDGRAIRVAAQLSSPDMLEDDFLKPHNWLILIREVEMFQWSEKSTHTDSDTSSDSPTAQTAEYVLDWKPGHNDFFAFRVPQGHENPVLTHDSFSRHVSKAMLGGYNGIELVQYLEKAGKEKFLSILKPTPEILKNPATEILGDRLYIRKTPGLVGDSVGDIRIKYYVLEPKTFTVIARQTETNKLSTGMVDGVSYFMAEVGDVSLTEVLKIDEQGKSLTKATIFGGVLILLGFLSLLVPFSAKMDLRPTAELTGKGAAVAVSAVLTVITVLILLVGSWLKR